MAALTVTPVEDERGYVDFLEVADRVYRQDRRWCKPPVEKVLAELLRPGFQRRLLLVREGKTIRGRVAALVSPDQLDTNGRPRGMLGYFEAQNHPEAAQALLQAGVDWLRQQGCSQIIGPLNGDTWHSYRFNVGPWDEPPFLMEPYNPPYYPALWEAAGFEVIEDYHSLRLDDVAKARQRFAPLHRRLSTKGYTLRRLNLDALDAELDLLYDLSTEIFADNFLYSPITRDAFKQLYDGAQPLLDPDVIWFALTPEGRPVGFVFCLRDLAASLTAMRGKRHLLAKLRFLLKRRQAKAINIKTLGVLPDYQRTGVVGMLIWQVYDRMLAAGFQRANLCLIRDGNASTRMDGGFGQVMRRYRLYHYAS